MNLAAQAACLVVVLIVAGVMIYLLSGVKPHPYKDRSHQHPNDDPLVIGFFYFMLFLVCLLFAGLMAWLNVSPPT